MVAKHHIFLTSDIRDIWASELPVTYSNRFNTALNSIGTLWIPDEPSLVANNFIHSPTSNRTPLDQTI
jgi:hypothetical protein